MDYVLDLTRKEIEADTAKIDALAEQEKEAVRSLEQLRITLTAGEQINSRFEQLENQRKRLKALEDEQAVIREREEALALSKKALSVKPARKPGTGPTARRKGLRQSLK